MKKIWNAVLLVMLSITMAVLLPSKVQAEVPSCVGPESEVHVRTADEFATALNRNYDKGTYIILDSDIINVHEAKINASTKGTIVIDLNGHQLKFTGSYGIYVESTDGVDLFVINSGFMGDRNTATSMELAAGDVNNRSLVSNPALFIFKSEKSSLNMLCPVKFSGNGGLYTDRMNPNYGITVYTGYASFVTLFENGTKDSAKWIQISGIRVLGDSEYPTINVATIENTHVEIRIDNITFLQGSYTIKTSGTNDNVLSTLKLGECTLVAVNNTGDHFLSGTNSYYGGTISSLLFNEETGFCEKFDAIDSERNRNKLTWGVMISAIKKSLSLRYNKNVDPINATDIALLYFPNGHIIKKSESGNLEYKLHNDSAVHEVKATCTTGGYKEKTCSTCGYVTKYDVKAPTGHNFVIKAPATPATCTTEGRTALEECTSCHSTKGGIEIKALGHMYGNATITKMPTVDAPGEKTCKCSRCGGVKTEEIGKAPKKGEIITLDSGDKYKVTKQLGKGEELGFVSPNSTSDYVVIYSTVVYNEITYKVTSVTGFSGNKKAKTVVLGDNIKTIGDKAFYNCKKLTTINIPKNVKKIGKQAFANCKKLKNITIATKKLTKKNVGSNAFKSINSKATIKVPKSKLSAYKKLLKSKGIKNQKIKK